MVQLFPPYGGFFYHPETRKITSNGMISINIPWVFIKRAENYGCALWHHVLFQFYDIIPGFCLNNCWKVVARPKNLKQMFELIDVMKKLDMPSKLGIETRPRVHGLYGCYFYNRSREEGLACKERVIDAFAQVDPAIPVILKRACTEMEDKWGNSKKWCSKPGWIEKEHEILGEFDQVTRPDHPQPPAIIRRIKRRWIEWAWEMGDTEGAKAMNGGEPLYVDLQTYEEEVCHGAEGLH